MNLFWYFGRIFLFLKSYKSSSLLREDFVQKLNDEIDDVDDNDEIADDEDIRLLEKLPWVPWFF